MKHFRCALSLAAAVSALGLSTERAAAAQGFRLASSSRPTATVPAPGPPGYLGGSDECFQTHVSLGTGPVAGMPFSTGTTGAEGQNEAGCNGSPGSEMLRDVWYDWTADRDGRADWRTCAGTTLDTRLRVWPFTGDTSCPADGGSVACDDDQCGDASSVTWPVTAGTSYTLQLGVAPGGPAGGGTFDLSIFEGGDCGQYDDGSTENALGHHAGELGWIHVYDCFESIERVQTAYGTLTFPGSTQNGRASRIAIYEDLDDDGDPRTGLVLLEEVSVIVMNANTDILNDVALPGAPIQVDGGMCVLASSDHRVFEFPGPMDLNDPVPEAWVVFNEGYGSLNLDDLNDNDTPPTPMSQIGFSTAWMLRAVGTEAGIFRPFCSGDGSGAPCPCANEGAPGEGCANSSGSGGELAARGSDSVSADDLAFTASGLLPGQPALLFAGENRVGGGDGIAFGDGLRCAGGGVVRLGIAIPDASGDAAWGPGLAAGGGWAAGDTRYFQAWYRDPPGPCGSTFNTTNGIETSFVP